MTPQAMEFRSLTRMTRKATLAVSRWEDGEEWSRSAGNASVSRVTYRDGERETSAPCGR